MRAGRGRRRKWLALVRAGVSRLATYDGRTEWVRGVDGRYGEEARPVALKSHVIASTHLVVPLARAYWSADVVARVDVAEHERRVLLRLGEVVSRPLLDLLMSLPEGIGIEADALDPSERRLLRCAAGYALSIAPPACSLSSRAPI